MAQMGIQWSYFHQMLQVNLAYSEDVNTVLACIEFDSYLAEIMSDASTTTTAIFIRFSSSLFQLHNSAMENGRLPLEICEFIIDSCYVTADTSELMSIPHREYAVLCPDLHRLDLPNPPHSPWAYMDSQAAQPRPPRTHDLEKVEASIAAKEQLGGLCTNLRNLSLRLYFASPTVR